MRIGRLGDDMANRNNGGRATRKDAGISREVCVSLLKEVRDITSYLPASAPGHGKVLGQVEVVDRALAANRYACAYQHTVLAGNQVFGHHYQATHQEFKRRFGGQLGSQLAMDIHGQIQRASAHAKRKEFRLALHAIDVANERMQSLTVRRFVGAERESPSWAQAA